MTHHFSQTDIDRLRECFYLYAPTGQLESPSQLRYIMRCLGYSATTAEATKYYKEQKTVIDFPTLLEVLHQHSSTTNPHNEIVAALRAFDTEGKGYMEVDELTTILGSMGEMLQKHEVARALAECKVSGSRVPYDKFVRSLTLA